MVISFPLDFFFSSINKHSGYTKVMAYTRWMSGLCHSYMKYLQKSENQETKDSKS